MGAASRTITVSGITLSDGGYVTTVYGGEGGAGLGCIIPGPQNLDDEAASNSNGTLTLLTSSPQPRRARQSVAPAGLVAASASSWFA